MLDAWLPKNHQLTDGNTIKRIVFAASNWQIYKLNNENGLLVCRPELYEKWVKYNLLESVEIQDCKFGGVNYKCFVSDKKFKLAPVEYNYLLIDKLEALTFAHALKETRGIIPDVPLNDSIYVEEISRLLPVSDLGHDIDDGLLLGTWLTGVSVPTTSIRRLQSLTFQFSMEDLEDIIYAAGLKRPVLNGEEEDKNVSPVASGKRSSLAGKKFVLTGAKYLEDFFFENVIDIVQNEQRYQNMGIGFPSPIVLYGKPGTGKTYAVEKLAEFLDWPVYSINSSSIGSPYIHQTGQKIAEVFHKAMQNSPSIIIIDEMEAYLGKREGAQDFKVEEVGEFLRLIPEAQKNKVLVVGMTNLLENIDPAILRTGRFDHKIEVKMPTAEDIRTMLDVALEKLPKEPDLNLDGVVQALTDRPRSDVAFVVKEAARLTAFRGKDRISQDEIDTALKTRATTAAEPKKKRIGFGNDD